MDFKPTKRTILFMVAMALSFIAIYAVVTLLTSLF